LQVPAGRARPAVIDALFQPPVDNYTWQFFGLLLVLALVVFVLFCIFQGLNWWFAAGIAGNAGKYKSFLLGFARVNVLWLLLGMIWFCLDAVFDLRRLLIEKATGQPATLAGNILLVVLVLVIYAALVSYPVLNIRKALALCFSMATVLIPGLLLVFAHFLVGNMIVRWLYTLNQTLMFVVGAVLLLVLISWARVYVARVVLRGI